MLLALAIWTTEVRAQSGCEDALAAELTRLRGPVSAAESERYRTTFEADPGGLRAVIRGRDGSERELRAQGPDCAALASATAVALALLLDAEPVPDVPPVSPSRAITAGGGAGLLLGIPRDLGPALLGELGYRHERWRVGLGALWAPPSSRDVGPGEIGSTLIAGSGRVCFALLPHLGLCSGAHLGALTMRARGYTRNEVVHAFWAAVPVELALDYVWGAVGAELGFAALLPVQRDNFSIDGLGRVQQQWPVQALFALRVFGAKKL